MWCGVELSWVDVVVDGLIYEIEVDEIGICRLFESSA